MGGPRLLQTLADTADRRAARRHEWNCGKLFPAQSFRLLPMGAAAD